MWIRVLVGVILVVVVVGAFLYYRKEMNAERKALEQVIQRQEEQLREKELRIQELERQLEVLRKEQVFRERRIVELRKKRQEIKPPVDGGEIVERFRKLGYEGVRVR
jgi:septal ring factor EnvC (AmiA/AmiB activator)